MNNFIEPENKLIMETLPARVHSPEVQAAEDHSTGDEQSRLAAGQDQGQQQRQTPGTAAESLEAAGTSESFEVVPEVNETNSEAKKSSMLRKTVRFFGSAAFFTLLAMMMFLVFTMVQSRIIGAPPTIAGHQMYIVLGGSMSPTFEAGSLAFVKPLDPATIAAGDIITYNTGGESLTTHRVMEVHEADGQRSFTTRGDANLINDTLPVLPENVVGKVVYALPYAGFLMSYGQTPTGVLTLIIIPGLIIIAFELRNLFQCAAEWEKEKEKLAKEKENETPGQVSPEQGAQ